MKKTGSQPSKPPNGDGKAVTVDKRFASMYTSNKFRRMPKEQKKVQIDSRFKDVLTDDRFKILSTKDRYGRDREAKPFDELKDFYHLEEKKEADEEAGEETEPKVTADVEMGNEDSDEIPDLMPADMSDGETGSSEDESSSDEGLAMGADDEESEEVPMIPTGSETNRLAIVNLDWDRVRAVDLLVLANSFLPTSGVVHSVTIYFSDFGREQMGKEDKFGPDVFTAKPIVSKKGETVIDEDVTTGLDEAKLHKRERSKLKYYFAVVVTNSVPAAMELYKQLDGYEIEHTKNQIDLRYIPDDVEFLGRRVKDRADKVPANYEPPKHASKSMGHTNISLTWDETPPERIALLNRKFTKKELTNMDYKAYLADSDHDDAGSDDEAEEDTSKIKTGERKKYASLLTAIAPTEKSEGGGKPPASVDVEFEADFGLEQKVSEMLQAKKQKEGEKLKSTFDRVLEKDRQKKKDKRLQKQQAAGGDEDGEMGSLEETEAEPKKSKAANAKSSKTPAPASTNAASPWAGFEEGFDAPKQKKKNRRKKRDRDEAEEKTQDQKELELLVEGDEKSDEEETQEQHIDRQKKILADPRFSALVADPRFNLDPTHNVGKKSKDQALIRKARQVARAKDTDIDGPVLKNVTYQAPKRNVDDVISKLKKNSNKAASTDEPASKRRKIE